MQGDIEMNSYTILGIRDENRDNAVVSRKFVKDELNKKADTNQVVLRNGSNTMTSNLDMNNQRIINLGNATHNQDAITLKQVNDAFSNISTQNNKYTDQKIAESLISTHQNRKNVLSYAMDDLEFTADFGIQDVNLITYNDSPHKTNKKAFSLKVQKTNAGSSLFKGRFDFNLFKMIRDNFSDNYTVCIEVYFEKDGRHDSEFDSFNITFEKLNMNIDKSHTIKINTDYKYYRSILNLSPDGTSPSIQRRLYVNVQSSFDNLSPSLLPLYVLIYGIKGEAKNDLDMTIYDYEKAYEVANNKFQLHVPINMNDHKITGLATATQDTDAISRLYIKNFSYNSIIVGMSTRAAGTTNQCLLTAISGVSHAYPSMYITKITLVADKRRPKSSNHKITFMSIGQPPANYPLDFSRSRMISVNINRLFNQYILGLSFNDVNQNPRSFGFSIEFKTII